MTRYSAVTVRAPLAPGAADGALALLREIRARGDADTVLPFARIPSVHFARVFVLEDVEDLGGTVIPASLVYMSDVDASLEEHLDELATVAAAGIDALFGRCVAYPSEPTPPTRAAWLRQHALPPAAVYVHTAGRSVRQVHDEKRLVAAIEDHADTLEDSGDDAVGIRRRILDLVASRAELAWATSPPAEPRGPSAIGSIALVVVLVLLVLLFLPVLLLLLVGFLLLIRLHERRDVPETGPVDPHHVHEVEEYEDWAVQNPFTAVGFVKPGFLRHATMRIALAGLDLGNRRFFARDNLAGVRTLHFARWVPLDEGRRLVFASSYDGSQESYMNDFIDRLSWGLNLVFSNGVGYPSTRWLIFGGARDETAFKRYLRRHQVPTVVWYSAYPTLRARRIDANATVRRGLTAGDASAPAEDWVARL